MRLAPCANIHFTLPRLQHSDGKMRRRAKTKQAHALAGLHSCHSQAAKTNDAGAEQRRGVQFVERIRKRKDEIVAGKGKLRIASTNGVAGESWRVTQILQALLAIGTRAVGAAEP